MIAGRIKNEVFPLLHDGYDFDRREVSLQMYEKRGDYSWRIAKGELGLYDPAESGRRGNIDEEIVFAAVGSWCQFCSGFCAGSAHATTGRRRSGDRKGGTRE
jgi:hypothetical protein